VRTSYDAAETSGSLRTLIHQIDSTQIIEAVHPMHEVVDASVRSRRAPLLLFSGFGAVALCLSAIGICGVVLLYVLQRRKEIGTRMALGAQRAHILRLILGHAAQLIVAGIVAGIAASLMVTRTLESLLYSVRPNDAATLFVVSGVLAGVALLACGIPLFRAIQIEPQLVLRNE
jgi:putative ABC transport system permease protein